jgi:hypothetical protein
VIEVRPRPEDDEISECDYCGQTFFTKDVLLLHLKKRHGRDDPTLQIRKAT